jgi:hypothetical protein
MQSEMDADHISIDSRETRAATPTPTLQGEKHSKAGKDAHHLDSEEVIFVDWDGPDDPANPQK